VLGAGDALERVPTERGAYPEFYRQLAEALTSGAPAPVDAREAVAALHVLDAARTSAAERRVVRLGAGD
jgi:predicted dehydrogenase